MGLWGGGGGGGGGGKGGGSGGEGSGLLLEERREGKRRDFCGSVRYGIIMISFSEWWGEELGGSMLNV